MNPFPYRACELATWISEETGAGAPFDALLSTASCVGLSSSRAAAVLGAVECVVATGLGYTKAERDRFADAFEHDLRTVAQRRVAEGRRRPSLVARVGVAGRGSAV